MILNIVVFIIVLSILVLVHELGHFILAKLSGVLVEEFGFGIPPRAIGKKIGETIYSLNWLPFGGFVRLHGEQTEEEITDKKRAFLNKSKKVRAAVSIAGVLMNFLLAVVAFAVFYSATGIPTETNKVIVEGVADPSPAKEIGLAEGDVIKSVNSVVVNNINQFVDLIDTNKGSEVKIDYVQKSTGSTVEKTIVPRLSPPNNEGPLGVAISNVEITYPPIYKRIYLGVYYGFKDAIYWGGLIIGALGKLLMDLIHGHISNDVTGPVGVYAITTEAAKLGLMPLVKFVGIFSVNLAIINILPLPALDGGRLFFIGVEAIFGKKVKPKLEATIHTVGLVVLIALLIAITVSDVRRLIQAGSLAGFLENAAK